MMTKPKIMELEAKAASARLAVYGAKEEYIKDNAVFHLGEKVVCVKDLRTYKNCSVFSVGLCAEGFRYHIVTHVKNRNVTRDIHLWTGDSMEHADGRKIVFKISSIELHNELSNHRG